MSRTSPKKRPRSGLGWPTAESPSLTRRRERTKRLALGGAFIVLVAAVSEVRLLRDSVGRYNIAGETVASQTVQAAFSFDSEDLEATRERRNEAAAAVPATFSVDRDRISNQLLTLQQRIATLKDRRSEVDAAIREALLASTSEDSVPAIVDAALVGLIDTWKADPLFEGYPDASYLKVWIQPDPATLPERVFGEAPEEGAAAAVDSLVNPPDAEQIGYANFDLLAELAVNGLRYVLFEGVLQPGAEVSETIVISRPEAVGDLQLKVEAPSAAVSRPDTARARLRQHVETLAENIARGERTGTDSLDRIAWAAHEMAAKAVTDTLVYDAVLTEGDRQLARSTVDPVMRRIEPNQILQEEGYRWTEQSRQDVRTYWDLRDVGTRRTPGILSPIFANFIFVGLLLLGLTKAMPVVVDRRTSPGTALNLALLVTCATLVLGRILSFFEPTGFLVPVAASAMLLTILTNPRLASVTTLVMAILAGLQYGQDWRVFAVAGAMGFTGIVSLYTVRRRTDMTRAAIHATIAGLVVTLAVALSSGSVWSFGTVQLMAIILLNGAVCMFVVPGLLSPLERLFGITTDIQLLEYSDLNNPLLSRLAIEVPATYAHSLMMGQLAEAAADAIGANGLMARVCAYYHDIGKLRRPEYFSENQTGYNVHEELSPRLSARAIASHVSEGVEIAREYHLPQPIVRGILEHHGTTLISFFYQQALDQQKHGDVVEDDFRYPGPKPQSPETAILMICDGVESGVRSIKHPHEERVREFITKIIQTRAADRQFDECDLTLKKLDLIGDVLTRQILTSMHARISYPERPRTPEASNVIPMSSGSTPS